MTKTHFDDEIKHLQGGIVEMGSKVEEMINKAIESLRKRDINFAKEIIEYDKIIDDMEIKLDEECLRLLALFQPVAEDLRYIAMGMKIINDLERIADTAVNVAECGIELSNQPLLKPLIDIPKMANLAQDMLREVLAAFVKKDALSAKRVWLKERESDSLRDLIHDELILLIEKDNKCVTRALPLILIARHLERICDLASNIAEDIVFITTGKVARHHPDIFKEINNKKNNLRG